MKLKKEFYVKGKLWRLEYVWGLRHMDEKMDGLCVSAERIIKLERSLSKEYKFEVFLHELVHAIIFESHIAGLDGPSGELIEEIICDSVADVFNDIFNMRFKRKHRD
jgi:hypothetical protein